MARTSLSSKIADAANSGKLAGAISGGYVDLYNSGSSSVGVKFSPLISEPLKMAGAIKEFKFTEINLASFSVKTLSFGIELDISKVRHNGISLGLDGSLWGLGIEGSANLPSFDPRSWEVNGNEYFGGGIGAGVGFLGFGLGGEVDASWDDGEIGLQGYWDGLGILGFAGEYTFLGGASPDFRNPTITYDPWFGGPGQITNPGYSPIDDPYGPAAPQIGGVDPTRIAEAIRIARTGVDPSFIKAGRSELDNPYGPSGPNPSFGRPIPHNPPDPFNSPNPADRPSAPAQSTRPWSDGGSTQPRDDGSGSGGSGHPNPGSGGSGSPGGGAASATVGGNGSGNPANDPHNGGNPTTNPVGNQPAHSPAPATPGSNPTTHTGAGYHSPNTQSSSVSSSVSSDDDAYENNDELHYSDADDSKAAKDTNGDGVIDDEDETDDTNPVLLDLNGNGVEVTELSRSNQFRDSAGDGLLHRTAWAAAGDGVLFYDVGNDGQITEKREYVFTEWDPTATSDLKALRAAFDTNGDGKLTAADAAFGQFKVMVSNADGSTTALTLAALGITEINLDGDATEITLPDGSKITAQTSFTRSNGTTGIVADTVLMAEANGHRVVQTATVDGAGSRTVVTQAYDTGGNLAYAITSVTSADGLSIANSYDDNGDGVIDRLQTISTLVAGDGTRTETLINKSGNTPATAVLVDRTVTTTSVDGKTVTIQRDSTGGGWFDQMETRIQAADLSHTNTTASYARDGVTIIARTIETVSTDGRTRTELVDADGNTTTDTHVNQTITYAGAAKTTAITTLNGDGSLRTVAQRRAARGEHTSHPLTHRHRSRHLPQRGHHQLTRRPVRSNLQCARDGRKGRDSIARLRRAV